MSSQNYSSLFFFLQCNFCFEMSKGTRKCDKKTTQTCVPRRLVVMKPPKALMRLVTWSIFIPLGISDSQSFVANPKTINRPLVVLINF